MPSSPTAKEILADAETVLAGNGIAGVRSFLNTRERAENRRLKLFLRDQDEELGILRERVEALECLSKLKPPKPKRIKAGKGGKPRKSAVLCLSDTHTTEIVTLAQTNQRNEHSPEIGLERIRSVVLQAIDEMKVEARRSDLQHLTVWLGGDFVVNSDLHYKFERSTLYEPLPEMEFCYAMLHDELAILAAKAPVDSISVVGSVSNHGRDTERMQLGLAADRSYDTTIYYRLAKDFPELDWDIARTYWTISTVGDYVMMFHHGHALGFKRNNSGAVIPQWAKLATLQKVEPFHAFFHGHYHSAGSLISAYYAHVANGSLVGENGFATDSGFPPEPPAQQLSFINHEHNQMDRVVTIYA